MNVYCKRGERECILICKRGKRKYILTCKRECVCVCVYKRPLLPTCKETLSLRQIPKCPNCKIPS